MWAGLRAGGFAGRGFAESQAQGLQGGRGDATDTGGLAEVVWLVFGEFLLDFCGETGECVVIKLWWDQQAMPEMGVLDFVALPGDVVTVTGFDFQALEQAW